MTKREEYGLSFYKSSDPIDGSVIHICNRSGIVNAYNTLQIIQQLNQTETQGLIDEINYALNGQYYEQYFVTDGTEHESIELSFPNVTFGENDLVISMQDLKVLLQEWLLFISS
jgi:hypothetical protein